jgi:D-alanine-D-alanine ligase
MTRIGFAYNQKPELPVGPVNATTSESRPDEEPPSSSDVYAEWDSAETIAAVATALSAFGDVIPLEATEEFPERLRAARPDIVFNIAEGLHGANREAHVPAICEFLDVPYSGSDPFTLSLCLHKARTKDVLTTRGIPNAPFFLIESEAELDRLVGEIPNLSALPQAGPRGIEQRNHRAEFRSHTR